MAQKQWERIVPLPGERADEDSEKWSAVDEANYGRGETAEVVGGVREVPAPAAAGNETGEGEGGASDKFRTMMEEMGVGTEAMVKVDEF